MAVFNGSGRRSRRAGVSPSVRSRRACRQRASVISELAARLRVRGLVLLALVLGGRVPRSELRLALRRALLLEFQLLFLLGALGAVALGALLVVIRLERHQSSWKDPTVSLQRPDRKQRLERLCLA